MLDACLGTEWERVAKLSFGPRLGEVSHILFLEVMGKYDSFAH